MLFHACRTAEVPPAALSCLPHSFTFLSCPFAVGIAASIRVGHLVGAGEAVAARVSSIVTVLIILSFMLSFALLMIAFQDVLGRAFTDDERVVSKVASLVWVASLFQLSDGMQAAVGGILRGLGRQRTVAWMNFCGFWLIGQSVGASLAFGAGLGVIGLWWGLAAGLTAVAAVGAPIIARVDWGVETSAALTRIKAGGGSMAPTATPAEINLGTLASSDSQSELDVEDATSGTKV